MLACSLVRGGARVGVPRCRLVTTSATSRAYVGPTIRYPRRATHLVATCSNSGFWRTSCEPSTVAFPSYCASWSLWPSRHRQGRRPDALAGRAGGTLLSARGGLLSGDRGRGTERRVIAPPPPPPAGRDASRRPLDAPENPGWRAPDPDRLRWRSDGEARRVTGNFTDSPCVSRNV